MHTAYILEKNSEKSLRPHSYPAIIGSACFKDTDLWGTAITVSKNRITVHFTDVNKDIRESYEIDLERGKPI